MRNPHSLELRKNQVMGQDRTSIIADDSELRDHIDAFSNQLCQAVDGQFDFTVQVDTDDETLQKLQMLTNFLLDSARRAVGALKQNTRELEAEIAERKKAEEERETLHHELLVTSRLAGMAEVATGVLHNVGNVLNSVNVSATLVSNRVRDSKFSGLVKATAMLEEHADDMATFLAEDPKGKQLPVYLAKMTRYLAEERDVILQELISLTRNVDHIKEIVSLQQAYAKISGVTEKVAVGDLIDDALLIRDAGLHRHGIKVVREYADSPLVSLEKQKVLQILVNLISNAKHALSDGPKQDKRLTLRAELVAADRLRIEVEDNGTGIERENLTRIFSHGFTTKKSGHGFGLHSCASTVEEMGGSLEAASSGPGHGAKFTLELPIRPEVKSQ